MGKKEMVGRGLVRRNSATCNTREHSPAYAPERAQEQDQPMNRALFALAALLACAALGAAGDFGQSAAQQRGRAVAVTVGDGHACALLDSGRVECWGGMAPARRTRRQGASAQSARAPATLAR